MADEKPELTPAQRSRRTLGLFLLVFVGPLLVLRVGCVSYGEVCERGGGQYGEVGDLHVCSVARASQACPRPYRWSEDASGCVVRGSLPVLPRWATW